MSFLHVRLCEEVRVPAENPRKHGKKGPDQMVDSTLDLLAVRKTQCMTTLHNHAMFLH